MNIRRSNVLTGPYRRCLKAWSAGCRFTAPLLCFLLCNASLFGHTDKQGNVILKVAINDPKEVLSRLEGTWNVIRRLLGDTYSGMKLETVSVDLNTYDVTGLPILLMDTEAPDIFMEWAGHRLQILAAKGIAADLTEELNKNGWKDTFPLGAWRNTLLGDRHYLIPNTAEISSLIWYNKDLFLRWGLTEPRTWNEFLEICRKIKRAGIQPLFLGNKDLWAAGNWLGHLISRRVGENRYQEALRLQIPFSQPDFLEAMRMIRTLGEEGLVNPGNYKLYQFDAQEQWLNGEGAMHPNGSWILFNWLRKSDKKFPIDFFNLPPSPGDRGDADSLIGVNLGFAVNCQTPHWSESISFLRLLGSPEVARLFISDGMMAFRSAPDSEEAAAPPIYLKMRRLLRETRMLIPPADTGYELTTADALNLTIAMVLNGILSPEEALRRLDLRLKRRTP